MRPHDERDPKTMQPSVIPNSSADTSLALIEEQADRKIRRIWHDGRWFFSVIDVIGVLTESATPRRYWAELKAKVRGEGFNEVFAKIEQLKMTANDGKQRTTDGADTTTMLRIVQSVPSPKAEPIKQWLAREGAKRLEALAHPIDPAEADAERDALRRPERDAPLLAWADYFEQMASLFRRQYAFEAQLRAAQDQVDEYGDRLDEQDEWLNEHAQRLEDHDRRFAGQDAQLGAMQRDIADLKATQRQLPDLLQRLGPQTLTPPHQAQVKALAVQLHDLGGFAFPTIYGELNTHFHVGKYSDIPDAEWEAVVAWFRVRLDATGKRRSGR
ncbi:MAG TPA: Bro-N domain-containing protein [Ktedonobacterales bacterium]|nr:Bro-N domain-containing protein [Ktedonobacterales bacterium]